MADIRLHVYEADGYLPAVCMYCGKPATTTITKRMSWRPAWAGGVIGMILTKYATVQAPFCAEHKGHWFNRALLMWGSFFLLGVIFVGGLVLAVNAEQQLAEKVLFPIWGITCGILFIAWIVLLCVCQFTTIRPKEITDDEIFLTGVCAQFVEAIAEADRERKRRRAERRRERERPGRWRDEADDDDEPRPRRRPKDDRFEE